MNVTINRFSCIHFIVHSMYNGIVKFVFTQTYVGYVVNVALE